MLTNFLNEKQRLELKVEGVLRAATGVIPAWRRTATFVLRGQLSRSDG